MLTDANKFFKVYANLPINERKLPVIVIDSEPISWALAYEEIKNETEKGKKILKMLGGLKLIWTIMKN